MAEDDVGQTRVLSRIGRSTVPVVLLIVVMVATLVMFARYRAAVEKAPQTTPGTETTSSVEATAGGEPTAAPGATAVEPGTPSGEAYVIVVTDNLNMRTNPITSSDVIKRLAKDERLTLLEKASGWYRVRDAAGDEGWVAAGGNYTKLVEP